MKLHQITRQVYHVMFETQHELFLTFIRPQEYYESPKFKGKTFSLEEFKKWYTKHSSHSNKKSQNKYYKDWQSFNIPSSVLKPFLQGKFNPLSKNEQELLKLLKNIKQKKFCIIGTYKKGDKKDLKHEIALGLFYTNKKYKQQVIKILSKVDKNQKNKILTLLIKIEGYSKEVVEDELHAYILADMPSLRRSNIKISKLQDIHNLLVKNFNEFYKNKHNLFKEFSPDI